jgi:1-deoxy-D-xylulose-5-phosphate synthase
MCDHGYTSRVKRLGVPDRFVEQGTQQELYKECGYDVEGIIATVKTLVKPKVLSKVI